MHLYVCWAYHFSEETVKISGIDVGRGWINGCRSYPQSAERLEELEENVWSVVRQKNELENLGEAYNAVVIPALMYRTDTLALKKAPEKKLEVEEMRMLYDGCIQSYKARRDDK